MRAGHPRSFVDQIYRSVLLGDFFTHGWGKSDCWDMLFSKRALFRDREHCYKLVDPNHPVHIESAEEVSGDVRILRGRMQSPMALIQPDLVKPPVDNAVFEMVLPKSWDNSPGQPKPMAIHLAGTGDHYFWRRRAFLAKPLAKEFGIGSIILENPFYGHRKPEAQRRSALCHVTDLFVMGGCLIVEGLALLHFCERQGYGPVCLTGLSMGGHMASLAACMWPKPVGLAPLLSWTTASSVFTHGVMSESIPWDVLQRQYDGKEFMAESAQSQALWKAFQSGRKFAKTYPESNENESKDIKKEDSFLFGRSSRFRATREEVVEFMTGVMDEFTHLGNYPSPVDEDLIIAVAADYDAYIPRETVTPLNQVWPNADIRYIKKGHILAFLDQGMWRNVIHEVLERVRKKYYTPAIIGSTCKAVEKVEAQ